mgnify:CR=1 FL=1
MNEVKDIIAHFINVHASKIVDSTKMDYTVVDGSILLHRMYSKLAESVNEVVRECVDIDKYHITTKDQVLEDGKKYRRDINFWEDSIDLENYDKNGRKIIFSTGNTPSEGEHKLLQYIRNNVIVKK